MRELTEELVPTLLARKDALASCDVAGFVYDRYIVVSFIFYFEF